MSTRLRVRVASKRWKVASLSELPGLSPCTVLTTPDVVHHFGASNEQGRRFVKFSTGGRRYFPSRLILRTVQYLNPLDDMLVDLLTGDLLRIPREAPERKPGALLLFAEKELGEAMPVNVVPRLPEKFKVRGLDITSLFTFQQLFPSLSIVLY